MEHPLLDIKPTFVRRVSGLFKDGNSNGSQLLFNNTSMQKLRHCCQNLSLFPYLLYSLDNSKSNDLQKLNIISYIQRLCEKIFFRYAIIRQTIYNYFDSKKNIDIKHKKIDDINELINVKGISKKQLRNYSLFLILSIYMAPIILTIQLIGIFSIMFYENYTPGFLFLFCALFCIGYISIKIFLYQKSSHNKHIARRKIKIH